MTLQSNTLKFRKDLIKNGMSEELAETVINGFHEVATGDLATKADLADLKAELKGDLADLKAELKGDLADLKGELKGDLADLKGELKGDVADLKGDLGRIEATLKGDIGRVETELKWIKVIGGSIFTLLVAIAIAVVKLAFFP